MDELPYGPGRLAGEPGELSRGRLAEPRDIRAAPQAGIGEAARRVRARVDAQRHEEDLRLAAGWQQDQHILARPGQQQRCPLAATAERQTGRGRRGSPAPAPGRQVR